MPSSSPKGVRHTSPDETNSRKRVGKACDRCRLKKSKCDGSLPCQRCLVDDQICVFSERKRAKDKTYPKGYVELLERRTQTLADAIYRILYCQQQNIDISHVMPKQGKIVINEVLARLEPLKNIPEGASGEAYTDELLEQFIAEQRTRQDSLQSDPGMTSDVSSPEEHHPHSPTEHNAVLPNFTFDGQYLSQQYQHTPQDMSKMQYYETLSTLPTSISPSLLLSNYNLSNISLGLDLDYSLSEDQLMTDQSWYS